MGSTIVVLALAALAISELVLGRIERQRKAESAIDERDLLVAPAEPAIASPSRDKRPDDYAELTPAEVTREAKSHLGPRAW